MDNICTELKGGEKLRGHLPWTELSQKQFPPAILSGSKYYLP